MIESINHLSSSWSEYFGLAVIQNTLFLGLIFLVIALLRNAPARVKYCIALLGLIKLLVPPLIPAPFFRPEFPAVTMTNIALPIESIPITSIPIAESKVHLTALGCLFLVWAFLFLISIIIPLLSFLHLKLKLRNAAVIQMGNMETNPADVKVKLCRSDRITMPITVGLFSKKVYVPTLWDKWSPECRQYVLNHERAHIVRRDGLVRFLQITARAIYFFHPLVWLLNRRINEIREMACDDVTVESKRNKSLEYSKILVKIAEEMTESRLSCTSASALIRQKRELLNRVQYQMEGAMKTMSKRKIRFVLIMLVLALASLSWTKRRPIYLEVTQEKSQEEQKIPPVKLSIEDEPRFIKHDTPPQPVGGYRALQYYLEYPESAKKVGFEGRTLIQAKVGIDGTVKKTVLQISSGSAECDKAADKVIKSVKWNPATYMEEPVEVWVAIPVEFKLQQSKTEQEGEEKPFWVAHDEPPKPVGGYTAIREQLVFPVSARKDSIEGMVVINTKIGSDGTVLKMLPRSTPDHMLAYGCEEAAMKAIESVKWTPAMKEDKPLTVWIAVPVEFRLNKQTLVIKVNRKGKIQVDEEIVEIENLKNKLSDLLGEDKKTLNISIVMHPECKIGILYDIKYIIGELRTSRISIGKVIPPK